MKLEHIVNFSYIVAAFLGVVMIQSLLVQPNQMRSIPYSEYQKLVLDGKVTDLVVGQTQIAGTYKQPEGSVQHFATDRVDPTLAQDLARTGVSFSGKTGAWSAANSVDVAEHHRRNDDAGAAKPAPIRLGCDAAAAAHSS